MPRTPVVEIDIDDSAFQRFNAAFADYDAKLKGMPASWQAMNTRVAEMAKLQRALGASSDKAWSNATSAAIAYERTVSSAAKAQEHLGTTTTRAGAAMGKMAVHAKAVRDHIFGAVRFLAKFSAFSVAGGLIGAGGLAFGLDDLAGRVLATQRTSRGLGLTSGQYNSFMANARQYAGGGVLAAAANAQLDPRAWGQLGALGVSTLGIGGRNATQIAGQEIMAIHRDYGRNPNVASAWWAAARAQGFSDSEIRNIGTAHGSSLVAMNRAVGRDAGSMGFSAATAAEYSRFAIQLSKAETRVGSAFITAMRPVVSQLTPLSREISTFLVGLEKSGDVTRWIKQFSGGIKDVAIWLQSPAFKTDLRQFRDEVGSTASALGGFVREVAHATSWIAGILGDKAGKSRADQWLAAHRRHNGTAIATGAAVGFGLAGPLGAAAGAWFGSQVGKPVDLPGGMNLGTADPRGIDRASAIYAAKYGIPLDVLRRQISVESGYGRHLYNAKTGASGVMQLMPGTAWSLGVRDPHSTNQSVRAGTAYDAYLYKKYGSWRKAFAAYDWGPANLDKDIAAHGKEWLRFAPAETQNYVASVMTAAPRSAAHDQTAPAITKLLRTIQGRWGQQKSAIHVTFHNPPAGRIYVSTLAAAADSRGRN